MIRSTNVSKKIFPEGGTILEFGCGSGQHTSWLIERINDGWPCDLIAFDSFQGLPKETEGVYVHEHHKEGFMLHPKEKILNTLHLLGIDFPNEKCTLVEGWFKDTLTKEMQESISNVVLIIIDVDIHSSTLEVLDFVKPLLQKGTIIYFDDWKYCIDDNDGKWGEHLAFEEWSIKNLDVKIEHLFDSHYGKSSTTTKIVTKGVLDEDFLDKDIIKSMQATMNIRQEIFDVFGHAPHQYPELSIISLNEAEFYTIMNKINYKPKLVLETGTASGCSALLLMQYAEKVITFDIIEVSMKYDIWRYFNVLDKISSYIIKDTFEIPTLINEEFDFAFLDGSHTYEGISREISIVEKCGRILFHDVYHPPIKRAIDELQKRNPGNYFQCGGAFGYWSNK